ncbi:unnamed protein product [Tilletia caries]|nr:hypothetical protein CF328_g2261 [Tilletia controversa]CAD6888347.1 unnamed protein product [Tilletia caries]CAD6968603.1 unnamed protein product [Tilletia controversa]
MVGSCPNLSIPIPGNDSPGLESFPIRHYTFEELLPLSLANCDYLPLPSSALANCDYLPLPSSALANCDYSLLPSSDVQTCTAGAMQSRTGDTQPSVWVPSHSDNLTGPFDPSWEYSSSSLALEQATPAPLFPEIEPFDFDFYSKNLMSTPSPISSIETSSPTSTFAYICTPGMPPPPALAQNWTLSSSFEQVVAEIDEEDEEEGGRWSEPSMEDLCYDSQPDDAPGVGQEIVTPPPVPSSSSSGTTTHLSKKHKRPIKSLVIKLRTNPPRISTPDTDTPRPTRPRGESRFNLVRQWVKAEIRDRVVDSNMLRNSVLFVCPYCDHRSRSKHSNKMDHLYSHAPEELQPKKLSCWCGSEYAQPRSLRRHEREKHGAVKTEDE